MRAQGMMWDIRHDSELWSARSRKFGRVQLAPKSPILEIPQIRFSYSAIAARYGARSAEFIHAFAAILAVDTLIPKLYLFDLSIFTIQRPSRRAQLSNRLTADTITPSAWRSNVQTISIKIAPSQVRPIERRVYRQASPTELIYISTGTTVVSRSRIAGAVRMEQFEAAVAHLETRHEILRAIVVNEQFVARSDETSSVEAWLSSETSSAEAIYAKLLNSKLDTSRRLYSIHVIAADDALDVFMLSSHAVTDATSLIELHSGLAGMCDCVVREKDPVLDRQPFPSPVDPAIRDALTSLSPHRINRHPRCYTGEFAQIPMRSQSDERPATHRLTRVMIGADDVRRISIAGHLHGSSVHSLLLAAFGIAIREVAQGRPHQILMRSNVDLRRRLNPHVSTETIFSAITAHITLIPDLDRPLFEIARNIFDDIHQGAADGSIFREYLNYPTSFGSPQQDPIALNVSDMQNVEFHWPTQRLKVTGFEYALGWMKKFPNVSVAIYEGTLIANIVYVEEFAAPETVQAIAETFVQVLLAACRVD